MDGSLVTLNGLLAGNRIFDIPIYQRNYAWGPKNLEDLWEDLYYLDPSKNHFFGTVLLMDSGETVQTSLATLNRFDLIDGQQRLTTIVILLREIISHLKEVTGTEFQDEVKLLERRYLKDGEHYKLNPIGADGEFFHHVLIDENPHAAVAANTPSQQRLIAARDFFRKMLKDEKCARPTELQSFLVQLKRKVDDLQLIQYQVTSDSDAIRIFETVNDRGRPLSNLEKAKSFLMHTSYLGLRDEHTVASGLKGLNDHFSGMYQSFEYVSRSKSMERLRLTEDDIQRFHFIAYISPDDLPSRLDHLKDKIREMLKLDPEECVNYVLKYAKDLEQAFFAVRGIADAHNQDESGSTLSKLFMAGRMGNIFPLLMASWLQFRHDPERMENILRLMEAFVVRAYMVGGRRSDTGRSKFYQIARNVHLEGKGYDWLINEFKKMIESYGDDARFTRNLRSQDLYNGLGSRTIKYILTQYEVLLRTDSDVPLALEQQEKILSPDYEVEHILAQTPSVPLNDEERLVLDANVHRLGNLTIASQSWNKSMGNKPFNEKKWQPGNKPSYSVSSLLVQRELAECDAWDKTKIDKREEKIIAFALQRWAY